MLKRILLVDIEHDIPNGGWGQLDASWRSHPIGLLYLASAVRGVFPDIEFRVFHTSTADDPQETVRSLLAEFSPDVIGLRSLSSARDAFILMARFIRELAPDTPLIAGGPYPNASYSELIVPQIVDLVVTGEGEYTLIDLVREIRETGRLPMHVPGTVVLDQGRLNVNASRPLIQNLDELPFPDYSLLDLKDYSTMANHAFQSLSDCAIICGSRGCPYRCFFCHQLFGKMIRRRSPENIVAEMRQHIDQRGIRNFIFVDDIFNVPKHKCKEVLRLMIQQVKGIRLNFPNGLRADQLDEELLDLFEQAGTVLMALAIESASPRLQKLMGKFLDIERAAKAIRVASKRFVATAFFIVGFPTETYEEAMDTIHLAEGLGDVCQPVLSVLRLYPGTFLYSLLNPTEEETEKLLAQQSQSYTPTLLNQLSFYGDVFPKEKVPLRGEDIKKLRWEWLMRVVNNSRRIAKSHRMLKKHFNYQQIIEFYRNFYDKRTFGQAEYLTIENIEKQFAEAAVAEGAVAELATSVKGAPLIEKGLMEVRQ